MASIPASVAAKESTDGQLMINPLIVSEQSDLLMVLLQFRNGSAARERKDNTLTRGKSLHESDRREDKSSNHRKVLVYDSSVFIR